MVDGWIDVSGMVCRRCTNVGGTKNNVDNCFGEVVAYSVVLGS